MFVLTLLVSLLLSTSSGAKNSERREERIYNKANSQGLGQAGRTQDQECGC
jgi:hypothetical protein